VSQPGSPRVQSWSARFYVDRVKNQPVLKFVKKFQPNPTQIRGGPGWFADSNPF